MTGKSLEGALSPIDGGSVLIVRHVAEVTFPFVFRIWKAATGAQNLVFFGRFVQ